MNTMKLSRRRILGLAWGTIAGRSVLAGMLPNQVPEQDTGIKLAESFLRLFDNGSFEEAYALMSPRARERAPFSQFASQLQSMRRRLGGKSIGRTFVGTFGIAPSANLQAPNMAPHAQWTIRFRSKYPAGALFEDINLEFDNRKNWAVAGWQFAPASF